MYIGANFEPKTIQIEQSFQAGFWWLTTAVAFVCILNRQIERHKLWIMRSYGFCLIFVLSRMPTLHRLERPAASADVLWSLVVAALVAPDLALTARELVRRRRSRVPAGKGAAARA